MTTALALPAVTATACRAAAIRRTWAADPQMPDVAGCAEDAVRVLAVRAAVAEVAGADQAAMLAAPAAVELTGLVLAAQFPEMRDVLERAGHPLVHGAEDGRWKPGDYLHQVYVETFGPVGGRHWPV
jgi:protein involved in temperature-dependent protein secretion